MVGRSLFSERLLLATIETWMECRVARYQQHILAEGNLGMAAKKRLRLRCAAKFALQEPDGGHDRVWGDGCKPGSFYISMSAIEGTSVPATLRGEGTHQHRI